MGKIEKEVGAWPHYAGSVLTSGAPDEASVSFAFSSRDEAERFHEAAIAMLEATTQQPAEVDEAMVERVARTLHAHGVDFLSADIAWDDLQDSERMQYRSWAKAAALAAKTP